MPGGASQTRGLRARCGASRGVADCSAILADPRCVLNIKSSAVIPLAAPNTNRGLPVAMATALLSNIASSGSASLSLYLSFLRFFSPSLALSSSSSFHLCGACVNTTAWICCNVCFSFLFLYPLYDCPLADSSYLWTVSLMYCK